MKSFLFFVFLSFNIFANEKAVTVIFLAEPVRGSFLDDSITFSKKIAGFDQAPENCVPMQGGCFHPQYGFIPDENQGRPNVSTEAGTSERSGFNATETQLVDCSDPSNYFNLYCGNQGRQEARSPSGLHVWVDISTSMRRVDYSRDPSFCQRRNFVEALKSHCSKDLDVSVFNTQLMPVSTMSSLCRLDGGNNTDRIIEWVERSPAKHILILSDVDEINPQMMNFLNSIRATVYGDKERIFSDQLNGLIQKLHFASQCQN